jgi:hypothetical protein
MTISARSAVAMGVAEVDLLCAAAGSTPPFPLRVPSSGVSRAERRAVLRAAGERLVARGLADERGPLGVAEAFAYLLQDARMTLDLVLSAGGDTLGVVLLARQDLAVLVTQELSAPDNLRMAELPFDDAVDELLWPGSTGHCSADRASRSGCPSGSTWSPRTASATGSRGGSSPTCSPSSATGRWASRPGAVTRTRGSGPGPSCAGWTPKEEGSSWSTPTMVVGSR